MQARVLLLSRGSGRSALLLFIAQALYERELLRAPENATLLCSAWRGSRSSTVAAAGAAVIGCGRGVRGRIAASILLSPLAPIGHARDLEATPGVAARVCVLGVGAIVLDRRDDAIALVVALPGPGARPRIVERTGAEPVDAGRVCGAARAPTDGRRRRAFALNRGTGRRATCADDAGSPSPRRRAVAASARHSREASRTCSRRHGCMALNFDYLYWPGGPPVGRLPPDRRWLLTDPSIAAIASGTDVDVTIDGVPVVAAAFEGVKGLVRPRP